MMGHQEWLERPLRERERRDGLIEEVMDAEGVSADEAEVLIDDGYFEPDWDAIAKDKILDQYDE
jgi:hypothetical protein